MSSSLSLPCGLSCIQHTDHCPPRPSYRVIDQFSQEFLDGFISLLSRRFGTRRIKANAVYQEYIQERHHLHMNATRWVTLTEFVKHLGKEGIVHVDENEKGFFISWVDNSPAALKRQAALQKMERQKMDDEGRQRKHLKEQIEKAKREEAAGEGSSGKAGGEDVGLRREEGEGKVKLGISLGGGGSKATVNGSKAEGASGEAGPATSPPSTSAAASSPSSSATKPAFSFGTTSAPTPFRMGANPLKAAGSGSSNPKPPLANAFKAAGSAPSSSSATKRPEPRTMAEKIMLEEEERKKRKMSGPMPSGGPGAGMKRIRM